MNTSGSKSVKKSQKKSEKRHNLELAYCPNIYTVPATVPINTLHPLDFPSFNLVISVEKFKRLSKICQMS